MLKQVSAAELKELDPKEFERQYYKWVEYHHWEPAEPECYLSLEEHGFEWDEIRPIGYSLGYSQSDVANIYGIVDVTKWIRFHGREVDHHALLVALEAGVAYTKYARIKPFNERCWSKASYEGCAHHIDNGDDLGPYAGMDPEEFNDLFDDQARSLEDELTEWAEDQSRQLYDALMKDYEYATSKEQFIEWADCNDETFDLEVDDETDE